MMGTELVWMGREISFTYAYYDREFELAIGSINAYLQLLDSCYKQRCKRSIQALLYTVCSCGLRSGSGTHPQSNPFRSTVP